MCCNCGTVTVFCTLTPNLSLNTTGMSTTWLEEKRAATVGSRLSPTMNAHHGPAQQTSITLSMYCNCRISGKTDHGNLRLRHAREVDDLDMHNNGHVNPVHNAQFETVRTCLCCITAIPSSVEELKRGTIHCPTKTAGTYHARAQRRHLCPVFIYRPGLAEQLLTQEEEEGGQTWRDACPCASTRPVPPHPFRRTTRPRHHLEPARLYCLYVCSSNMSCQRGVP